jgi:hypothetical protein
MGQQKEIVEKYTGVEAVRKSLINTGKMQGFYIDGKFYDKSDNIS